MVKRILIGMSVLILLFLIVVLRPIPIVSEEKALVEKGIVVSIVEGTEMDVIIRLQNNPKGYYINRGLERGLTMIELREKVLGNEVTLKYPKFWTPLDWNQKMHHLSKLETTEEVVFNELKEN